jgi:hypothetical protein
VAVGDFNADGKPDLALAGRDFTGTNSNVSVLLGKGDNRFQSAVRYSSGGSALCLAVGDFNADRKADLVVANQQAFDPSTGRWTNSSISMLLGKGDGTFRVISNYSLPFNAAQISLAVGDFNGDGKLDLAMSEHDFYGTVWVLLGKGDGSFEPAVKYAPGLECYSLAVGDFNGDGNLDLAVANEFGVLVLLNTCLSAGIELSIVHTDGGLTLSWPYPSTGFVLEVTTTLTGANWQPAMEVPVNDNGRLEVIEPVGTQERYFRLRKP